MLGIWQAQGQLPGPLGTGCVAGTLWYCPNPVVWPRTSGLISMRVNEAGRQYKFISSQDFSRSRLDNNVQGFLRKS